jgi:signal transduction histidine kinase/CheY-like chemotaxis protein
MLAFWALLAVTVGGSAVATYFGFETLSAVRAYVGGEGLWSKAQKDATYHLVRHARSGDSLEYARFRQLLDVQLGDRQARIELDRPRPDYRLVREGFLRGRIHPKDVDGLAWFFRRFRHVSYVSQAIDIWAAADSGITELAELGDAIHAEATRSRPDRTRIDGLLERVDRVDARLAALEDRFSTTLGAGARWARRVLWIVILGTAALLVGVGGTVSWRFARHARSAEATRYALEAQLRQAQKMEAIGQFTGGIAHDFNNLLTIILSNVELLKSELSTGPAGAPADLAEIEAAARKAAAMVRKLLAFSRTGQLELGPVDLPRLVRDLSVMLHRLLPETIDVGVMADGDVPQVLADPGAVEQILFNLATNARDAMPRGGALRIAVDQRQLDERFRDAMGDGRPGLYACLSVSDTGAGMDPAVLEHMFEPFFTTKPPGIGTGLGMAMVYGLVRQHGGLVDIESEPGRGTTVRVYFPAAARADAAPARPRVSPPPGVGGTETVLLVEDEDGIRRVAQRALERAGYRVLTAADGVEGLKMFGAHSKEIHLVVSDVVMPRCGGPELRDAVRKTGQAVPFLFMSGYAARGAGSTENLDLEAPVLHKPWSVADLLGRVRQVLDAERGSSAA